MGMSPVQHLLWSRQSVLYSLWQWETINIFVIPGAAEAGLAVFYNNIAMSFVTVTNDIPIQKHAPFQNDTQTTTDVLKLICF